MMSGHELITTADGSHSVRLAARGISFHSTSGAIRESSHVFIDAGWKPLAARLSHIRVIELGFGTGLNALLTFLESEKENITVDYQAVDLYPLELSFAKQLNYPELLPDPQGRDLFERLHEASWNKVTKINNRFSLGKWPVDFKSFTWDQPIDLFYHDAFAPDEDPDLWTVEVFDKIFRQLTPGGYLVTYSAKGAVRRNLERSGFKVARLPGAPPKREMLRAQKPD